MRAQAAEQRRLLALQPAPPLSLRTRVWRWFGATASRELAWQLSLLDLLILGLLRVSGALATRLGRLIGLAYLVSLIVHARHAVSGFRSGRAVEAALADLPDGGGPRMPISQLALPILMLSAPHRRVERGRVFAEVDGAQLRLDVYRPDEAIEPPAGPGRGRPAIIEIHGGGWVTGSRNEQGIPLLNHMTALGWVGFNIDYRLSPQATWPDHVVDVKRAIAWVRANAADLDVDPERIAITGGSAGGHLTALAALTENDRALQPGFEDADTSVVAAVPFYGVYDLTNDAGHYYPELGAWAFEQVVIKQSLSEARDVYEQASPLHRVHSGAPPFLIIHGDRDSLTPVGDARDFAAALEKASEGEVRYIELPGAEHAFDLWPSLRTARVVDGVGRFLGAVTAEPAGRRRAAPREPVAG